jgi:hypothetical protein
LACKFEMNRSKNTSFADRLRAAADAKKAQLERAARAKSAAESPAAVEQRTHFDVNPNSGERDGARSAG